MTADLAITLAHFTDISVDIPLIRTCIKLKVLLWGKNLVTHIHIHNYKKAHFLASIILDAIHEKNCWKQPKTTKIFFLYLKSFKLQLAETLVCKL